METRNLIIVRGCSGSGKSTISRYIAESCTTACVTCEADDFFTDANNKYHFNQEYLQDAHAWCRLTVKRAMLHESKRIVVANTFIKHWEMKAYNKLAEEFGYTVEVIRTPGPWIASELFERNTHGVPPEVVQRHIDNYQPLDGETEWSDTSIFS